MTLKGRNVQSKERVFILDFDNLEGYRDAHTYDLLNDLNATEWKFYFDLATQQGSPILDVACGTGRYTIPLTEQGFNITGLDVTTEMLEAARQKAGRLGVHVNWIHADARRFELGRRFRFIFTTGNSFQHFLDRDSVESLLQNIHQHLDDDGVFAFETRNPVLSRLSIDDNLEQDGGSWVDKDGYRCSSTYRRSYDHKTQLEHYIFTDRRWKDESTVVETVQPFALRYFFPQEIESLLHYNGFQLDHMYGNFDLSVFDANSPLMVCVCRKRH